MQVCAPVVVGPSRQSRSRKRGQTQVYAAAVLRLFVASLLASWVGPATASTHAVTSIGNGQLSYRSEDTGSASRLGARASFAAITVYDPGTFGSLQASAQCQPGRTDANGNPAEFTCPATGISELALYVGGDGDVVDSTGPFRQRVDGEFGRTGSGRVTSANVRW